MRIFTSATLAIGVVAISGSLTAANAGVFNSSNTFFGEDIQHFANPGSQNSVTTPPDIAELVNGFSAEQAFLKAIGGDYTTLNFEPDEHERFKVLGKTGEAFAAEVTLKSKQGDDFKLSIYDANSSSNTKLHTSIDDSVGSDVAGGRYGISDVGATAAEREVNQFLNTNAGKDSSLTFTFSDPTSAFGFWGTDFERGGVMGLEFTLVDGSTEYVSLGITAPWDDQFKLKGKKHGVDESYVKQFGHKSGEYLTTRGTSFFWGYKADAEDGYFTQVRFDVSDAKQGTNDMVAFDRMTFASPAIESQDVPEPAMSLVAFGAIALGGAFSQRQRRSSAS
jgi:hypothetical protein